MSVIEAREDSLDGMTGGVHTMTFNPTPPREATTGNHAPNIGPGTANHFHLVDRKLFPRSVYPDHLAIESPAIAPNTIRDYVVYTVPSRALKPDAKGWGDFNVLDNPENFELLRSFSFFMYALEKHVDHPHVRVFAEAIVCNRGQMQPSTGAVAVPGYEYKPYAGLDLLLARSNIAGYRIWVLFSCRSAGPETMMRRAVIELQGEVKFCMSQMQLALRKQFATIIDEGYRDKAIAEYIELKTQEEVALELARLQALQKMTETKSGPSRDAPKRKSKSKRRKAKKAASAFVDDEAGGDSADDEDDPRDENDVAVEHSDNSEAMERLKIELYRQLYTRTEGMVFAALKYPHNNSDISNYKNTRQKLLWHQHVTVGGSLINYLRRFILPIHAATRTSDEWKIGRAEQAVYGEWPDCVDFSKIDEVYWTVYHVLDFDKSAAILEDIGSRGADSADGACPVQTALPAYGLDEGQLYFPMRDLIWELSPHKLGVVFLSQTFFWGSVKFADMLTTYWTQIGEVECLTKNAKIAKDGIHVPTEPNTRMTHNFGLMASAASRGSEPGYVPPNELDRRLRKVSHDRINGRRQVDMAGVPKKKMPYHSDMDVDSDEDSSGPVQLPGITGDYEKMTIRERLQGDIAYLQLNPNRGDVISVIENAFAPMLRSHEHITKQIKAVATRLPLPKKFEEDGVDPEVYRRIVMMRLHRIRRSENFDKVMAVLAEARDTSDIQNQLYRVLSAEGSVQHRQVFTIVPGASIHANMLIADATILQVGTGVHHGVEHYHHALTMILSAADPQPRMAQQASITLGAPATGKSMLWALLGMVLMGGSTTETGHTSQLDGFNASRVGTNSVQVMDEMGPIFSRHTIEVQAANADKIAKAKSQLSLNGMTASRLGWKEGPTGKKAITERTERDLHHATIGNVNTYILGPGADMALATRHDLVTWMTSKEETVSVVDKINDPNKDKRIEFWKSTKSVMVEDQAVAIFISILYRCGVIDSINTDVLSLVTNTALSAGSRWFPQVFANIRGNLRQEEFARKGMIRTAVWRMLRSQASPLLMFSGDLSEIIGSNSLDIRDIAQFFSPHLYSTYEDAIAAITRMMLIDYSPDMWLMIRAVASLKANFRRELMKRAWRANGLDLIDDEVARIMRERGDVFQHQSIVDMNRMEATLDFITSTNLAQNPLPGQTGPVDEYAPQFARFWDTTRASSQARHQDRFGGAKRSASFEGSDDYAGDVPSSMSGGCDPNWIVLGSSYTSIADSCMPFLSQLMSINNDVARSVFGILATKVVRVPLFNLVRNVEPHLCKFESITVQRDVNGAPRYDNVPVVKVHVMGKDMQEVRVSTCALMLPPAHLLFVMLTSGENQYTRPVTTVLPMMVRGFPNHFYQWKIKPRKNVTLSIINHASNTSLATARQSQMPIFRDSGILDNISKSQVTITDDFEKMYFENHMRASNNEPEYKEWLSMLRHTLPADSTYIEDEELELAGNYPTPVQYEKMMRHWIDHSDAQPGYSETRVRYLYKNSAVFASSAQLLEAEYPRTDIAMERMKYRVLNMCKEPTALYMPRSSEQGDNPALCLQWTGLHKVSSYVKCLEWKLFAGDWHAHLLKMQSAGIFSDVVVRASNDVYTARQDGDAVVPASALTIPAELAIFVAETTAFFSSKTPNLVDSVLLADFDGPEHMDFLDQFFTFRQALREISLVLSVNPAMSISQAFEFAMDSANRDTVLQMNTIVQSCKIARATAASCCEPGQEMPALPNASEYSRYLSARDTVRSLRANLYFVLFTEHSQRIYWQASQMASASGERSKPGSRAAGPALAIDTLKRQSARSILLGTSLADSCASAPASVLGSAPPGPSNPPAAAESLPTGIDSMRPRFPDASAAKRYSVPSHLAVKK